MPKYRLSDLDGSDAVERGNVSKEQAGPLKVMKAVKYAEVIEFYEKRNLKQKAKHDAAMKKGPIPDEPTEYKPEGIDYRNFDITPKFDGIRASVQNGVLYSYSGKPIRNKHIQHKFSRLPNGFDGELYLHGLPYTEINSRVMSYTHPNEDDIEFHVFDWFHLGNPLQYLSSSSRSDRLETFLTDRDIEEDIDYSDVRKVPRFYVESEDQLYTLSARLEAEGYEGVMLRHKHKQYKFGNRPSASSQECIKVKPFETAEARIVALSQATEFVREIDPESGEEIIERDAFGNKTRNAKQSQHTLVDEMGALIVEAINGSKEGVRFQLGTGFSKKERKEFWQNRENLIGQIVEFKMWFSEGYELPRHPSFLRFRHPDTL